MRVLKKISLFNNDFRFLAPVPLFTKKLSQYKPLTRLQKIKIKSFLIPNSIDNKFVYVTKNDGNGFTCQQTFLNFPPDINSEGMLKQINNVCYSQWQKNRLRGAQIPYKQFHQVSNRLIIAAIMYFMFIIVFYNYIQNHLDLIFALIAIILFLQLIISLKIYCLKNQIDDPDAMMIKAIFSKLKQLNEDQNDRTNNNPTFVWSSNKECFWIAIKIVKMDKAQRFQEVLDQ